MPVLRTKCGILGNSGVGKTSIVQAFLSDGTQFPKNYSITTAIEVLTKTVNVSDVNDSVEFYLFDCPGELIFFENVQKQFGDMSSFLIVFDITSEPSFNSCTKWAQKLKASNSFNELAGAVVANKIDLATRAVINSETAKEWATGFGLGYFETSAKEAQAIEAPFHYLAKETSRLYHQTINNAVF